MLKVLQPFEVGDCDTSYVGKHVGYDGDAPLFKKSVTVESGWAIGSLKDDLRFQVTRVRGIHGTVGRARDKYVTLLPHHEGRIRLFHLLC